jgi:uncharacterized protein (TIGR03083 family)
MSTLEEITAERRLAADLLESLREPQLAQPSLCAGWTVRDVFGHQLMTISTPLPRFAFAMLKARGDFDVANDRLSRAVAQRPVADLVAGLRAKAGSKFHAPGFPLESALADLLIHGQDVRRPLRLARDFDPISLHRVLDFLITPKALGAFVPKGRLSGVRLEADDLGWRHGDGPPVIGRAESLIVLMAGRDAALADVYGDGVALIRAASAASAAHRQAHPDAR